jgi:hypothetical protein
MVTLHAMAEEILHNFAPPGLKFGPLDVKFLDLSPWNVDQLKGEKSTDLLK